MLKWSEITVNWADQGEAEAEMETKTEKFGRMNGRMVDYGRAQPV